MRHMQYELPSIGGQHARGELGCGPQPQNGRSAGSPLQKLQHTSGVCKREHNNASMGSQISYDFQEFWEQYPRKVGKFNARKAWAKLDSKERLSAIKGLKLWCQTVQWQSSGGMYIPYASTFLNQRRWEDEPWNGAFEEQP